MDDFLIFNSDKAALRGIKQKIRQFLSDKLNLTLHEGKSQIFRTKTGIKFLGFRIYQNHRRLTTDNVRRFKKRLKKFSGEWRVVSGEKSDFTSHSPLVTSHSKILDSVRCWVAHSKYANSAKLRLNISNGLIEANETFGKLLKPILRDGIDVDFERERERERVKKC